jgi:hypothetical protein
VAFGSRAIQWSVLTEGNEMTELAQNFKVAITSRVMQWSVLTEGK